MSTDLQFPTPPIPDRPFPPPSTPATDAEILQSDDLPAKSTPIGISTVDSDETDCPTTPTAVEHKIPVPTSPPPAPQKRRRVDFPACKRRLDFFDAAHTKEVEDFFTSRFAEIQSRRLLKRRCPCT
uniref:Uncharacterized protein n=1 Tax=Opuntia streptacantha TaxID=393608 RepID=A0A7C9CVQ5_OPUST